MKDIFTINEDQVNYKIMMLRRNLVNVWGRNRTFHKDWQWAHKLFSGLKPAVESKKEKKKKRRRISRCICVDSRKLEKRKQRKDNVGRRVEEHSRLICSNSGTKGT